MKYDDASWHYGGDFPSELAPEAGATHIAMFVAWAQLSGLGGTFHEQESAEGLASLRSHEITPREFFLQHCDGKFTDEDLSDLGNAFAAAYYGGKERTYYSDYALIVGADLPSLYHVPDTWSTYVKVKPVLDKRFAEWRDAG